jgi:geranylgeranyl pyrophosphate synthase
VEFISYTACILADADQITTNALVNFARSFGISFQIKDDIHDFGSSEKWTKEPGVDLACGKLTYVILLALEAISGNDREFMMDLLGKNIPPTADNILRGIKIVQNSGALQKANAKVFSLLSDAWGDICKVAGQSDARIMLKVMCEHLLNLEYSHFDVTA